MHTRYTVVSYEGLNVDKLSWGGLLLGKCLLTVTDKTSDWIEYVRYWI